MAFVYLAVHSQHREIRQHTLAGIEQENIKSPRTIHAIIPVAITEQLNRIKHRSGDSDENVSKKLHSRFSSLVLACANFGTEVEIQTKEELLADLILLAHHPEICESLIGVLHPISC